MQFFLKSVCVKSLLGVVALSLVLGSRVHAQAYTFDGGAADGGQWGSATNWNPDGVPSAATSDTVTIAAAQTVTVTGIQSALTVSLDGTLTGTGTLGVTTLNLATTGLISGSGTLNIGTLNWTAGNIGNSASSLTANITTLNISGAGMKVLGNSFINLSGIGTFGGTADVTGGGQCFFTLASGSTLNLVADQSFGPNFLTISSGATLRRMTGTGNATIGAVATNMGTVEILSGTLTANYTQTAGSTTLNGGNLGTSIPGMTINGGTLGGVGTITGPFTISGNGVLAPGGASTAGKLIVIGSPMLLGNLRFRIGGPAVTDSDQLVVLGTATFTGSFPVMGNCILQTELLNGFVPTSGSTFDVMTFGAKSGAIGAVLNTGSVGFTVSYLQNGLRLTVPGTRPVPTITAVNPDVITVGAVFPPTIVVKGSGFDANTLVQINGVPRTATLSGGDLTFTLLTSETASPATLELKVTNSGPGGGTATSTIDVRATAAAVMTSALTATATVGQPFSYRIEFTGTGTFTATGLPEGLSLFGNYILGTPTKKGIFPISITAPGASILVAGTTKILQLTVNGQPGASNMDPIVSSLSTTFGFAGFPVTFGASVSDPDGDGFQGVLDFGDGTSGILTVTPLTGTLSTTHTYTSPGLYTLTLRVSDSVSTVTKVATIPILSLDNRLVPQKAAFKLNFAKPGNDTLQATVGVPIKAGTTLAGAKVTVQVGLVKKEFTLDENGKSPDRSLKISAKVKGGVLQGEGLGLTLSVKGEDLAPLFAPLNFSKIGLEGLLSTAVTIGTQTFVDAFVIKYQVKFSSTGVSSGAGKNNPGQALTDFFGL